ncbi:MAG: glycosyltransferase [Acidobacteriota bacterium]
MRILVSGNLFEDSFARNIVVTAEHMGHAVMAVDESPRRRQRSVRLSSLEFALARAFPAIERSRYNRVIKSVQSFHPDIVLACHGRLPPEVVRRIKQISAAKVAVWFPDHMANLDRQYALAGSYDAWFFKDRYMAETFREKLDLNAHYLPEACNPLWHRRVQPSEAERAKYGCDLCTASNMYYYRARMVEIFKDYDLKIWGNGYPPWLKSAMRKHYPNVYVAELEKAKAFNSAKIVLNTMHYGEIMGVNCRLFEAAGCGAFQIADHKPVLPELFEPEREIVTFRTRAELKEKVDYYLARPEERKEIAGRAYARAHREHTYELRLVNMFEVLGLAAAPGSMVSPRE